MITVEIIYLTPAKSFKKSLVFATSVTIRQALLESTLFAECPDLDIETINVGIFSKKQSLEAWVEEGSRIEVYRPLLLDPKEQRRQRKTR